MTLCANFFFANFASLRLCERCIWFLYLFLCSNIAHAQAPKFRFEPAYNMPTLVDDRPAMTDWVASVDGTGIVEGRLDLRISADNVFLGRVVSDELVFSGLDQKVRILFPAFNWDRSTTEILVDLKLITKHGTVPLPVQRLRTTLPLARKFPLLMGESKQKPRSMSGRDRLADRLRIEALLSEEFKERAVTIIGNLPVTDFPQEPLAYCHYEVVAIPGDAFAALRPTQMDALLKWVKAGGSLYLEPSGILEGGHVEFLNQLAAEDPRKLVFTPDDKGRLPDGSLTNEDGFLKLSCGLGRVALSGGMTDDLSERDWRLMTASLWKFQDHYRHRLEERPLRLHEMPVDNQFGTFGRSMMFELRAPAMSQVVTELTDLLRPQGVKMVPLWVIATILGGLVLLIGPVDYFLLGWLGRRKWTWITFPASLVAMTGLTIALTNAYLASSDTQKSLVLHDVGPAGDILRTNRFELLFMSSNRRFDNETQAALFTPLLTGGETSDPRLQLIVQGRYSPPGSRGSPWQGIQSNLYGQPFGLTKSDPVTVRGRVPNRFRVAQDVNQWTPQLNRKFSIGPSADAPQINWNALHIPQVPNQPMLLGRSFHELTTAIRQQFGPQAEIAVLADGRVVWTSHPAQQVRASDYATLSRPFLLSISTIHSLSLGKSEGLHKLTTHTSPHAGKTLDDVPLDTSPDRWYLLVMVPQGDDFVVYRKSCPYSP